MGQNGMIYVPKWDKDITGDSNFKWKKSPTLESKGGVTG
jgi:hypothetical protein